ncbi:MAG: glycoside hydrolase family 3 C-terminal domain-containing protein [Opitutaceae bacterium]
MLFPNNTSLPEPSFKTPVSFEAAGARADALLAKMSRPQKLGLISGHAGFHLRGYPELGIPQLYMSDASGGINIRRNVSTLLEKSTAFPNPLALAATWNPGLAYTYARSIGEECRAGGVAILLGPGMNIYRHAQYGRNFEYFGEDPLLAARIAERYVTGVLDTGTIPTIKHFIGNETDHYRRTSNSVIDERTLHEIYLPAFKAAIAAGAMAVMTSYNLLNGEWCGQSRAVIHDLLRGHLGYKWLVMTDWWSVFDAKKVVHSGQDLEMPGEKFLKADADRLLESGEVAPAEIDRMVKSILRTTIAMGLHDRPVQEPYFASKFVEHEQVALQTARESIVLLKNDGLLPLSPGTKRKILLTGRFVEKLARGLGSAEVEGYNHVTLLDALRDTYSDALQHIPNPTDEDLKSADIVLLSTGTQDSEGWDRPFALPAAEEQRIAHTVSLNPRTVVLVNAGGGIQMTAWNERAAAIVYAWYPGQNGNRAVAEIVSGETNPSGKLPITIERRFEDSPGYGYIPKGEELYVSWDADNDMSHPVTDVAYHEGIFVGYRWYEHKKIAPLYAFGHGLSYTTFAYSDLRVTPAVAPLDGRVSVEFTVTNTGEVAGTDVAQIYLRDPHAPVPRPEKELKGFNRVALRPGESKVVRARFTAREFAYWDVTAHAWRTDAHAYTFLIGPASNHILLEGSVTLQ